MIALCLRFRILSTGASHVGAHRTGEAWGLQVRRTIVVFCELSETYGKQWDHTCRRSTDQPIIGKHLHWIEIMRNYLQRRNKDNEYLFSLMSLTRFGCIIKRLNALS
jgi:hypothetical protein